MNSNKISALQFLLLVQFNFEKDLNDMVSQIRGVDIRKFLACKSFIEDLMYFLNLEYEYEMDESGKIIYSSVVS
jgi:hypothetical protein